MENAAKAGIAERYQTAAGSAFDVSFSESYDVVLLTNFLHHFDLDTCHQLLRKMYGALKPGGKLVTLEFVPNEDRVSPPIEAGFALTMLASTIGGDAYTYSEYQKMFVDAGFVRNEIHQVDRAPQHVILSYRA